MHIVYFHIWFVNHIYMSYLHKKFMKTINYKINLKTATSLIDLSCKVIITTASLAIFILSKSFENKNIFKKFVIHVEINFVLFVCFFSTHLIF